MEDERVAPADMPSLSAGGDESDELDLRQCRQVLGGDNQACAELFKRHEARIARLMWRFTRDRGTQAELVHEVFVQVYLSLPGFRPRRATFEHWLFRIATRVGYQFWKRQARRRRMQPLGEFDPAAVAAAAADRTDPAAAAETLHRLLAQLPSADRLVLTLKYFEDCSMKEIARRTGWNETLVKMRAYRARQRLKRIIEQNQMTEFLTGMSHGTT
jgi:RNA polymerase sigma-70 factor (ECF subfamily)